MTLPTEEEITKLKDELIECVQTMKRNCESAWNLIGKLHYKNSLRNCIHIDHHGAEWKFKNGKLSYLDSEKEISSVMKPENARKLAYQILADIT